MGMAEYTAWAIKHPWHVSGYPESGDVPPDCDCNTCTERREAGSTQASRCGGCGRFAQLDCPESENH